MEDKKTSLSVSTEVLEKMAELFNCSVDYLLGIDRHDNESA